VGRGVVAVDGGEDRRKSLAAVADVLLGNFLCLDRARGPVVDGREPYVDTAVTLPGGVLTNVDRASVRAGHDAKVNSPSGKRVLRQMLDWYPALQLVECRKTAFDRPIGRWLRRSFRDWASPLPVHRRRAEKPAGARGDGYALWTVPMYQSWRDTR
jgi:hypothetical protein